MKASPEACTLYIAEVAQISFCIFFITNVFFSIVYIFGHKTHCSRSGSGFSKIPGSGTGFIKSLDPYPDSAINAEPEPYSNFLNKKLRYFNNGNLYS